MALLPDVVGLSPVAARGLLRALGLSTDMIEAGDPVRPLRQLVAVQQPGAGQPYPANAIVHLVIDVP